MSTKIKPPTGVQQRRALRAVAAWLGPRLGHDGPAPTGEEAAYMGIGPMLDPAWLPMSGDARPTIILEGGPEDWAIEVAGHLREQFQAMGVFAEPYSTWALCLYRLEDV